MSKKYSINKVNGCNAFEVMSYVANAMKDVASMMDVNAYSRANVTKALNSTNTTTINLNVVSELDGRQVAKSVAKSVTRSTSSRLAFQGV